MTISCTFTEHGICMIVVVRFGEGSRRPQSFGDSRLMVATYATHRLHGRQPSRSNPPRELLLPLFPLPCPHPRCPSLRPRSVLRHTRPCESHCFTGPERVRLACARRSATAPKRAFWNLVVHSGEGSKFTLTVSVLLRARCVRPLLSFRATPQREGFGAEQ
ncbi:hypothetical protein CC85DRAFT_33708 [Cutaneotrichosporon oleaginosum]|uniref:Uncharacterized protein n=1 Tax=Cutaneotrichosporon oleaginosum TaxID=879819 RepID=A0A0J1ASZ8_9TREE|nr:uncharacterized protein CC85DRAFT_33708 [Cutaneotrichosporon oleaginosum]KLT38439.1 hypothetical protein CC85DRAFT_33708 [Cutaneotrichosporon oleaginosum]TXT09373.1 hypothetical protein COLE_03307 [Cutaneotrichosporon oleaginosum]